MYQCYTGKIDYDLARKLAADVFVNRVNEDDKPVYSDETQNYWGNEALLADSVKFLFNHETSKDGNETVTINPKFTTQPVPFIKVGLHCYVGPSDLLSDLTIYEFKEASWRIGKYSETRDDNYLNQIFAVLYQCGGLISKRKKRTVQTHDRASVNQERNYNRTLKAAVRVPIGLKFMIFLFSLVA